MNRTRVLISLILCVTFTIINYVFLFDFFVSPVEKTKEHLESIHLMSKIVQLVAPIDNFVNSEAAKYPSGPFTIYSSNAWRETTITRHGLISRRINQEYLTHLSTLGPIPKKIHIAWNDTNVLQSKSLLAVHGVQNLKEMNPEWEFIMHKDIDIEQYLKKKLPEYDYQLLHNRHIVEKIDVWRLLIIYYEGGYYQDLDRLYNIPLDELITKNGNETKMLLPSHYDINFAQDIMCSSPGNKLFKLAIDLNLSQRRRQGMIDGSNYYEVLMLGPKTYFNAVTKTLFDIVIQQKQHIPEMRDMIDKSKYFITYNESWCDLIVFHTDDIKKCQTWSKQSLWKETNHKKHWSIEIHDQKKARKEKEKAEQKYLTELKERPLEVDEDMKIFPAYNNTENIPNIPGFKIDIDIYGILGALESLRHEKDLKYYDFVIPNNTDDYVLSQLKIIYKIELASIAIKRCMKLESEIEFPIGIPQIDKNVYDKDALNRNGDPMFCLLYSPGYTAGISLFNEFEFYELRDSFREGAVAYRECYLNKSTNATTSSLYFDHNGGKRNGVNLVLLITGDACDAFQHFIAWIPARYAMIHRWLMNLIVNAANKGKNGTDVGKEHNVTYFNITIATNAFWERENSIQKWFWEAVGYHEGVNIKSEYVNITILDIEGWCGFDTHQFYAPLIIAPFVFNTNIMHKTRAVTLTPMYSWNVLHSIKPLISNIGTKRDVILYLDRGYGHDHRGVINNFDILGYLGEFATLNGYELIVKPDNDENRSFDKEKEIFSRSLITIGPHGGMFGNIIFMQYGSYVIEFNGWLEDDYRPFYHGLAQSAGLHYYYIAPKEFKYFDYKMTINMNHLAYILNHICTEKIKGSCKPLNPKPPSQGLLQGIANKLGWSN